MNYTIRYMFKGLLEPILTFPNKRNFSIHLPSKNKVFGFRMKFTGPTSACLRPGCGLNHYSNASHDTISTVSSIQLKKRPLKRKKTLEDEATPGVYNVVAFATAEEYNLEKLTKELTSQGLYEPKSIPNDGDVVYATGKQNLEKESRDIFIFREGAIVLWNIPDPETVNLLKILRQFEEDSYSERLVHAESEAMNYKYHKDKQAASCVDKEGNFVLSPGKENLPLLKYTFSNAMMLSVKLGIWESFLDSYIEDIESVTNDLKMGKKTKMTREEVLRKHGELFALRHYLNLSSDILDTPDFYWDNEKLENLFNQVCLYFSIAKRTRVMNEKINHCVALIELLSSHLSDKHMIRLEWIIIVLIFIEVIFETVHYVER